MTLVPQGCVGICVGLLRLVLFCQGQVAEEGSAGCAGAVEQPCPAASGREALQLWWHGHMPVMVLGRSKRQGKHRRVQQCSAGVCLFRRALSNMVTSSEPGTGLEFRGAEPCPLLNEVSTVHHF